MRYPKPQNGRPHRRAQFLDEPEPTPHVFNFLTHEELILCFCVGIVYKVAETQGYYPLTRYSTSTHEDHDSNTDDWTEITIRAIRYLAFEHGMQYVGIVPHKSGAITAERPITPGNSIYVALFRAGGMPDFDILLPRAVRIAGLRVPSLDVEPMRALASMIEEEIAKAMTQVPEEQLAAIVELRRAASTEALKIINEAMGSDIDAREPRLEMTESGNTSDTPN